MTRQFVFVFLAAAVLLFAAAETTSRMTANDPGLAHAELRVGPKLIPATPTDVFTSSIYIEYFAISNKTGSDVAVTIVCKDGSDILTAGVIKANNLYPVPLKDHYCPSGVTWSAADGTSLTGYMWGKQ